jgi:hypothetical protein
MEIVVRALYSNLSGSLESFVCHQRLIEWYIKVNYSLLLAKE